MDGLPLVDGFRPYRRNQMSCTGRTLLKGEARLWRLSRLPSLFIASERNVFLIFAVLALTQVNRSPRQMAAFVAKRINRGGLL